MSATKTLLAAANEAATAAFDSLLGNDTAALHVPDSVIEAGLRAYAEAAMAQPYAPLNYRWDSSEQLRRWAASQVEVVGRGNTTHRVISVEVRHRRGKPVDFREFLDAEREARAAARKVAR